ncbi:MlaD family protein [Gordonia sp. CPCC 205333]|uniref:MlaD family protein n=1 Tax=Gordonia sp. CPCC 205333 TaxID=3140790 RepID=UPI003AF363C5
MKSRVAREFSVNVAVFAVVIILGGVYLAVNVYEWRPGTRYHSVTMSMTDTDLVAVGTGVFVNGMNVGEVSAVELEPTGARLTMKYPSSQQIPADTSVEVGMQSALGEPYVNFVPKTSKGPFLSDGAVISADRIAEPESIPGIFEMISDLSSVTAADPLSGVLKTVSQALAGTDDAMGRISDGSRLIAGVLMSRSAQLRSMFANTQIYTGDIEWLVDALPGFGSAVDTIFVRYLGTLHALESTFAKSDLHQKFSEVIDPFLVKLNGYLTDVIPNVVDAIGPMMPIATALNETLPMIDVSELLSRALQMMGSGDSARFVIRPSAPN